MENPNLQKAKIEAASIKRHISKGEHSKAKRHCENIMSIDAQKCVRCVWWKHNLCSIKQKLEVSPDMKTSVSPIFTFFNWKHHSDMAAVIGKAVTTLNDRIYGKNLQQYFPERHAEEIKIDQIAFHIIMIQCRLNEKHPKKVNDCIMFTIDVNLNISIMIEALEQLPLYLLVSAAHNKLVNLLENPPNKINKQYKKGLETLRDKIEKILVYL